MKPRVAFIGTGGTIASQGAGPLDTTDYGSSGKPLLAAAELLARFPEAAEAITAYPIAPLSASKNPALAKAFTEYVIQHGGPELEAAGFLPAQ